jgi:hypothetical protein
MGLERGDPFHMALLNLALSAAKLVDDLHEYEHWLTGGDSDMFSLRDVERDYDQITRAWDAFRTMMERSEVESRFGQPSRELSPGAAAEAGEE